MFERHRQQRLPLQQQPQHQSNRADRADMGILHHRQETLATTPRRQPVADIRQTVQVQGAGYRRQGRHQQRIAKRTRQPGRDQPVQRNQQRADGQPRQREDRRGATQVLLFATGVEGEWNNGKKL